jgi:hypothetical protein
LAILPLGYWVALRDEPGYPASFGGAKPNLTLFSVDMSIVVAAMAVSHYVEIQTGWSLKKFVRTARRYRTVKIKAGRQILTAADPLPDDLREALTKIRGQLEH